jgi:hypothetical protein
VAFVGGDEAGEDAEEGAFSGAGWAEDDGPWGGEGEGGFEGEGALLVADGDFGTVLLGRGEDGVFLMFWWRGRLLLAVG